MQFVQLVFIQKQKAITQNTEEHSEGEKNKITK